MRQDRRDPYPWTWEPALAGLLACGLLLILGVHVGRGVACLAVGAGFCWASKENLLSTVWPILTGDASAGLTRTVEVSSGGVLVASITGAVLGLLSLAVTGLLWFLRRWGPGALKGVASPGDVERLLGRRRLYRARRIVRPDLYGRHARQVDVEASDATV